MCCGSKSTEHCPYQLIDSPGMFGTRANWERSRTRRMTAPNRYLARGVEGSTLWDSRIYILLPCFSRRIFRLAFNLTVLKEVADDPSLSGSLDSSFGCPVFHYIDFRISSMAKQRYKKQSKQPEHPLERDWPPPHLLALHC